MSNRFSSAKHSIAECDRCAQRYKLKQLKTLTLKTKNIKIKVCPECWEPDQPQLLVGMYPVDDPQAVREPRPDVSYLASGSSGLQVVDTNSTNPDALGTVGEGSRVIQWGWAPVGGASGFDTVLTPNYLIALGQVGTVTVTTDTPGPGPGPGPSPGAPVFTTCSPPVSGAAGGGTAFIIGSLLTGATSVTFGGVSATGVTVLSDTTVTAVIPAHAAGTVSVAITTPGGTTTWSGTFTYY